MRKFPLILLLLLSMFPAQARESMELSLPQRVQAGRQTVAYLRDLESGLDYALGGERVGERHPPFSTFKIPNFLIALETGAAESESCLEYDPEKRPRQSYWPEDWAQDQNLHSAFRRSAAWAFQDLAQKIGEKVYETYLSNFRYGNQQASGDAFWLDRSLAISPREQVNFLERLVTEKLAISPAHIERLKRAALDKEVEGYRLFGKTGSGPVVADQFDGPFEGWYVGWLERPEGAPVVFAVWAQAESYSELRAYRRQAAEAILAGRGYLPPVW